VLELPSKNNFSSLITQKNVRTDINFVDVKCLEQENVGQSSGKYENNEQCEALELVFKKCFLTTILLDPDHKEPTA